MGTGLNGSCMNWTSRSSAAPLFGISVGLPTLTGVYWCYQPPRFALLVILLWPILQSHGIWRDHGATAGRALVVWFRIFCTLLLDPLPTNASFTTDRRLLPRIWGRCVLCSTVRCRPSIICMVLNWNFWIWVSHDGVSSDCGLQGFVPNSLKDLC